MTQRVDMAALERVIGIYCAAWNEPDPDQRDRMLQQVWAADATYTDPTVHLVGRRELVRHIDNVLTRYPGSSIVMTSALDAHHGVGRFAWKKVLADGSSLPEGVDFAEIDGDGKLSRIVGFFGPLAPAAKAAWP